MRGFVQQQDILSVFALATDIVLYLCGVYFAVLGHSIAMKIGGVLLAGTATSTLFILGHDAAHRSLFKSKLANAIVGRIVFFPCLHNHSLWLFQHNHLHHQQTNVKGLNSYSPMSLDEFRAAPAWRRALERLYRSFAGFGLYYLVERWAKHKFIPTNSVPRSIKRAAKVDFALLGVWIALFCSTLYFVGANSGYTRPFVAILWGFVMPFLVWNQLMGLTAFVQHTNPRAYWLREPNLKRARAEQVEVAIDVRYPAWYDFLSHNIMIHAAHHVNPRIPWYRLKAAKRELELIAGEDLVAPRMTPGFLWSLCRDCQLYDYDARQWLDFNGRPTLEPVSGFLLKELPIH